MKSGSLKVVTVGVAAALLQSLCMAAEQPGLANPTDKLSYSIGMSVGVSLKRGGFEVDTKVVADAINAVLSGGELKMTEQEAQQTIAAYQQELRAKREQERVQLAEKNRAEMEKFLAANKQNPGIQVHEVKVSENNTAELQYKVLSEGEGESPRPEDTVTFNYTAKKIDGTEIDSTARRGQPAKTVLNHYRIAGVKEALQKMKPGSKWQLFIPSSLAFGDTGDGQNVEPGSAIIYEVELVGFDKPQPPQPLTSDIIKVPSKEELDRGEKIQVITAEELRRMQETNAASGGRQ
jgi:FKBP-type peptidyl-prolyl cis-trans isomerase FklB